MALQRDPNQHIRSIDHDTDRRPASPRIHEDPVKPGDVVYTVLRHVAQSKASRSIDLYMIVNNEPICISGYVAKIIDAKTDRGNGGVKIRGGGMDMGFALVYEFSARLFPDGFDIKPGT